MTFSHPAPIEKG